MTLLSYHKNLTVVNFAQPFQLAALYLDIPHTANDDNFHFVQTVTKGGKLQHAAGKGKGGGGYVR